MPTAFPVAVTQDLLVNTFTNDFNILLSAVVVGKQTQCFGDVCGVRNINKDVGTINNFTQVVAV
ncbi:hypothetical protein D3C81_2204450 [compost metagenome]